MMRWTVVALLLAGCSDPELPRALGEQCDLTSDCDAPLVCRLARCRKECATSRDCAAGLDCLLDNDGLGACQLPEETRCDRDSDCPDPLVCTMGECTNRCNCDPEMDPCPDCPPGARCIDDEEGARACIDLSESCVYGSECPNGQVCATDQRCRPECRVDEDCRYGTRCMRQEFIMDPLAQPGMSVEACMCVPVSADDVDGGTSGDPECRDLGSGL